MLAKENRGPICTGVVLCNSIIEDVKSHGKSLISTFSNIGVAVTPTFYKCGLYVAFIGIRKQVSFKVRVLDPDLKAILELVIKAEGAGDSDFGFMDVGMDLPPFPIGKVGRFRVEVLLADKQIGQTEFEVVLVDPADAVADLQRKINTKLTN